MRTRIKAEFVISVPDGRLHKADLVDTVRNISKQLLDEGAVKIEIIEEVTE